MISIAGVAPLISCCARTGLTSHRASSPKARCKCGLNPWGGSLVAFEEPENGVHPRRLELIADLLTSLVLDQRRQLIATTHSALFCDAMLKKARLSPDDIGLFTVGRGQAGTEKR